MHEDLARALRTLDHYYSVRVHHIKICSPAKCVLNILLLIVSPTASHVYTFVQPLANPVDPVLTAFDLISAILVLYCTMLSAGGSVFGRVASHGVSLSPVSDTE